MQQPFLISCSSTVRSVIEHCLYTGILQLHWPLSAFLGSSFSSHCCYICFWISYRILATSLLHFKSSKKVRSNLCMFLHFGVSTMFLGSVSNLVSICKHSILITVNCIYLSFNILSVHSKQFYKSILENKSESK